MGFVVNSMALRITSNIHSGIYGGHFAAYFMSFTISPFRLSRIPDPKRMARAKSPPTTILIMFGTQKKGLYIDPWIHMSSLGPLSVSVIDINFNSIRETQSYNRVRYFLFWVDSFAQTAARPLG